MKLVLDTAHFSLIQGDSLAVLRSFADKSFDVALFDPPYSKHVHEKFGKERRNDGVVPIADLDFPPMTQELIDAVAREVVRITRGWILVTTDFYNTHLWGEAVKRYGGSWVRSGHWVKTNPKPQMSSDRPGCGSEDILIAHAEQSGFSWNGGGHSDTWRGDRDHPWPTRDEAHPNQKPLWLMQSLLGAFCKPGALVIDPYAGSSTVAEAALAPERFPGERPLETSCKKCVEKLLEKYQSPLPQNVSVVAVEGAQKYIDLSIRRIRERVPSVLAA
jgi:site-specific DNA-methyltransferase (adenine-specific)